MTLILTREHLFRKYIAKRGRTWIFRYKIGCKLKKNKKILVHVRNIMYENVD